MAASRSRDVGGISLSTITTLLAIPASLAVFLYVFGLLVTTVKFERLYHINPAASWYLASMSSRNLVEMQASWYLLLPSALAVGLLCLWVLLAWLWVYMVPYDRRRPSDDQRRPRPFAANEWTWFLIVLVVCLVVYGLTYKLYDGSNPFGTILVGGFGAAVGGYIALRAIETWTAPIRWVLWALLAAYIPALVSGLINVKYVDARTNTLPQVRILADFCSKDSGKTGTSAAVPTPTAVHCQFPVQGDLLDHANGTWQVLVTHAPNACKGPVSIVVKAIPDANAARVETNLTAVGTRIPKC